MGKTLTIYCVGRNFAKHAQELGNEVPSSPLIFLKADSSLRSFEHGPLAFKQETFHYEAELVIQIGKNFEMGEEFKLAHIDTISLGIDLTRRQVQNELKAKGLPWTMAKSFAGSAILGKKHPFSHYAQCSNLIFKLKVNEEFKQVGETKNMIFSFEALGNFINSFSALKKGDLIYTGTPEGVGEIRAGDLFEMQLLNECPESGIL